MQCPKCGASQEDRRDDCSSCGIIFARWRAPQDRNPSREFMPLQPPPAAPPDSDGIPGWMVVAGIVILAVVGLLWTAHRRAARAHGDDTAELNRQMNEINARGNKQRALFEKEQAEIARAQYRAQEVAAAASRSNFPEDLTETRMMSFISDCGQMKEPVVVALPKTFQASSYDFMLHEYPALFPALRDHYAELDPPLASISANSNSTTDPRTIMLRIPVSAYSRMLVNESDREYQISLGRRVVDQLRNQQSIENESARVAFAWHYEQMAGESLGPEDARTGGAQFVKEGSFWKARTVWLNHNGTAESICSQ